MDRVKSRRRGQEGSLKSLLVPLIQGSSTMLRLDLAWSSRAFAMGLAVGGPIGLIATVVVEAYIINWAALCHVVLR